MNALFFFALFLMLFKGRNDYANETSAVLKNLYNTFGFILNIGLNQVFFKHLNWLR